MTSIDPYIVGADACIRPRDLLAAARPRVVEDADPCSVGADSISARR